MNKSQLKRFYGKSSCSDRFNLDPFLSNKTDILTCWDTIDDTPRKKVSIKKNKLKEFQKFFNLSEKFSKRSNLFFSDKK